MKVQSESSIEDIILVCIDSVIQKSSKCSFGSLVKECFIRYPNNFSLNEAPEYPDSLKLDRPLREMREKGIIVGSPTTFYLITNLGRSRLSNLKSLGGLQISDVKKPITHSPALQMLEKIKSSADYSDFQKNKDFFEPNDMTLRSILGFTLETSVKKINSELEFLIDQSQKLDKPEVLNYLKKYKTFFENRK